MIGAPSLLFLLFAAAGRQDPAIPAPSPAPAGPSAPAGSSTAAATKESWRDLDLVLQIVNEEILTTQTRIRDLQRINKRRPITNPAEAREADRMLHAERVKDALRVQAGQDLGIDPAQLDRQVKDYLRRKQESLQGSAGMAAYLQDRDRTLYEEQELTRDLIHAKFWDDYITGEGAIGAGARPSRDVFVRPGYLRYAYRQCLDHPELLGVIDGSSPGVVLQQMFLDPGPAGSEEAGRTLAESLRQRILDGEDMGDLVESYDAAKVNKQKRGMTEPLDEARLKEFDAELGAFVAGAKPGDVSEVLPYESRDKKFWHIVRLVERRTAVVPELGSAAVQKKLTDRIKEDLAGWRREQAFRELYRASYVWPSDLVPASAAAGR
jgi:hypothetical protein